MLADFSAKARNRARSWRDGTRTTSLDGRSVGDTVRVRAGRSVLTARIVDRFDAWALRDECRDEVAAALSDAGIAHLELDSTDDTPHRVVVSARDARRVPDALAPLAARPHLHVARVHGTRPSPARPLASFDSAGPGDVVRIFSAQISRAGRLLPTTGLGVDLEIWEQVTTPRESPDGPLLPAGTLVAPRVNPHARFLPPEALTGRSSRPATPALEQVAFPIDVVYTWVDADDPDWQADFAAARQGSDASSTHTSSVSASRFTSREELRYSLRSLAAFASWVRTIHVVTNGQVPAWLDTDHPRIRVVTHDEIFPDASHLPTFNSHAIEANLHRIPGLAEHYLYLNDDVFFGRIAYPGDFFSASGLANFFPSDLPIDPGPVTPEDLPIMAAAKNGRALLAQRFGIDVRTKIRHTVHAQLRSVAEQIEAENPEEVARTRDAWFRSPTDLSLASSLHHWYAYALGRAVPSQPNYLYLDLASPGVGQTLDALESLRRYDTFCLNQELTGPSTATRREVGNFLRRYLPTPAPWEKR